MHHNCIISITAAPVGRIPSKSETEQTDDTKQRDCCWSNPALHHKQRQQLAPLGQSLQRAENTARLETVQQH